MTARRPVLAVAVLSVIILTVRLSSAQDCYSSTIRTPSPFMGNHDEIFTLADGSIWQVKNEYQYLYEYYPRVVVCPSRGKLTVGSKSLNVQRLSSSQQNVLPSARGGDSTKTPTTTAVLGVWSVFENSNLQGSISGTVKQGHVFKTTSGNIYEVTGLTLQLVLELQPSVLVLRSGDTYKLIVDGFKEPLICRKLNTTGKDVAASGSSSASVVESQIDGEFTGWSGDTIFKLRNGQIWQQSSYAYSYRYAYAPKVLIYSSGAGYKMKVDGVSSEISVQRLK